MCSFFECLEPPFLRPESVCKVTAIFAHSQNHWRSLTLFNLFGAPARVPSALFPKSECKGTPFWVNSQIFLGLFSHFFCHISLQMPKSLSIRNIAPPYFFESNGKYGNYENNESYGS